MLKDTNKRDLMNPHPLPWGYTLSDALAWYRKSVAKARDSTEALAFRALIAAAPELLAALIELDQWAQAQQGSEYPQGTFSTVQEAINKAMGVK